MIPPLLYLHDELDLISNIKINNYLSSFLHTFVNRCSRHFGFLLQPNLPQFLGVNKSFCRLSMCVSMYEFHGHKRSLSKKSSKFENFELNLNWKLKSENFTENTADVRDVLKSLFEIL